MAHVVLGLLLIAPQSLYDLVKAFESGGSLLYSASTGSIKRALDNLLRQGLIEVASAEPGVRGRKVYRATDDGRDEFHSWMVAEVSGGDAEAAALHRFFFLGLLGPTERITVLRLITTRLEADLSRLTSLGAQLASVDFPEEHREIAEYQLATLEYGIGGHRRALDWFLRCLEREQA